MGVAWFYHACPDSSSTTTSPTRQLNRINNNNIRRNLKPASSYEDDESVDIIDIEDEDHSFAAFFIGMKTGPSPYVKRPLVITIQVQTCSGRHRPFTFSYRHKIDDVFPPGGHQLAVLLSRIGIRRGNVTLFPPRRSLVR